MPVFIDNVERYYRPLIQASIKKALEELRVSWHGKKNVFIKVNIVRPAKPKSCIVTHPVVVEALIHVLREYGINEIVIGEGPAAGVDVEKAFKTSRYIHLAKKMNLQLLDLHKAERVKKHWDYGFLELPRELFKTDLYINVSKMKTHFHTGVTLSVKSQQGLLSPQAKKANHREYDLHKSLVSIAKVIQPDLVIIDAIDSMDGGGPTKGNKKHTRVMVYGDNLFETDVACCQFMGISPNQIEHLNLAIREGLAKSDPDIRGEAFMRYQTMFRMPSPRPKKVLNFYSWKNYRACAEDEHCFEEAIHLALTKPIYWFTFFPKFLYLVLFKRFHLLRGKDANIPKESGHILCIGNCCKDVADEEDAHFVPGCPPKPEDIIKTIIRMK